MATMGPGWQCHLARLERGYVAEMPSSAVEGGQGSTGQRLD
jgi:hypothetical protein